MTLRFPQDHETADCVLVPLSVSLVPLYAGMLSPMRRRALWFSDDDYEQGYRALAEVLICMGSSCAAGLQASIDRLYRLLDMIATGTTYTWTEQDGVVVVEPAIPPVPDTLGATPDSLLGLLRALPGVLDAGWFGIGSRPATLADVVNALRANTAEEAQQQLSAAIDLLGDTSDVATIANFVTNLLGEGGDVVGDAGTTLMIALLAVAQTAMGQQLAGRLDRLIAGLDGGGGAPPDNLLMALRGATPAGAERNVIDQLLNNGAGQVSPADIDRLIAELVAIKETL